MVRMLISTTSKDLAMGRAIAPLLGGHLQAATSSATVVARHEFKVLLKPVVIYVTLYKGQTENGCSDLDTGEQ